MGLDRGLSPVYDLLVDRYFTIPDGLEGSLNRLKENKIARYMMYILLCSIMKLTFFIIMSELHQ